MGNVAGHALHDLFAITGAVDAGLVPTSSNTCSTCALLHSDLVALRHAIPAMVIPSRPCDYRLTAADADRLRPNAWRRLVTAIGTSRDRLTQPLAVSFTGLGLVGLLLGSVPASLPFDAVATAGGADAAPADAARASEAPVLQAVPSIAPEVAGASAPIRHAATTPSDEAQTSIDSYAPGPLAILSVGLLGVGGGLFAVRRRAARRGPMR